MVRNYRFDHTFAVATQYLFDSLDLEFVDTTAFDCQRTGGIDTNHSDIFISVEWLQVVADVAAVFIQGLKETRQNVVKRNVMVSRDNDLRPWQGIEERARLLEFM